MVLQLLPLRRLCAEQRTSAENQVLAPAVLLAVNKKVFLFRSNRRIDMCDVPVSKQTQDAQGLFVKGLHRAQERRFFIERNARIGIKNRRNAQRVILDERIGRRVPRGIAARLKGRAQTAGRKARRVRFALDKFFPGKLHNDPPVALRRNKAVVLFSRDPRHRLEPLS